jgi:3-oxoacyl-[acyl-carrier protein] reductase
MRAAFFCAQAVVPRMKERQSGIIVNISSGLSRQPGPGFVAHSSAKGALDAFTRALALELGPFGIRVNTVAPGLTLTDATRHQPKEAHEAMRHRTPLKRLGEPEDIAGAVLFYCADWSRFVTGTYLPVCGGTAMP